MKPYQLRQAEKTVTVNQVVNVINHGVSRPASADGILVLINAKQRKVLRAWGEKWGVPKGNEDETAFCLLLYAIAFGPELMTLVGHWGKYCQMEGIPITAAELEKMAVRKAMEL